MKTVNPLLRRLSTRVIDKCFGIGQRLLRLGAFFTILRFLKATLSIVTFA